MKAETLIYDKARTILPQGGEKTVFFAAITQSSYEVFFYTFMGGKPVQCYKLAEEGKLDADELDAVFAAIADILKESRLFHADKSNVATILVDEAGVKMTMEYYDRDVRLYGIKKEWKQKNICND